MSSLSSSLRQNKFAPQREDQSISQKIWEDSSPVDEPGGQGAQFTDFRKINSGYEEESKNIITERGIGLANASYGVDIENTFDHNPNKNPFELKEKTVIDSQMIMMSPPIQISPSGLKKQKKSKQKSMTDQPGEMSYGMAKHDISHTERKKFEESFRSAVNDEDTDNLRSPKPRPELLAMQGAKSIANRNNRFVQRIESMQKNEQQKRKDGKNVQNSTNLLEKKKEEWMQRDSFRSKLEENADHTEAQGRLSMRIEQQKEAKGQLTTCMLYPEAILKHNWDLLITITLIFTCLVVPVRIAFVDFDTSVWVIINESIDAIFVADIIITFNTAFYDKDFRLIHHRKQIAITYFRSWFLIDLLAVVPFDMIMSSNSEVVSISKLGRMYRLTKLTRLIRIMKLFKKAQSGILKQIQEFLNITSGFERLFNFILSFLLLCHIGGCLWVMAGKIDDNIDNTWIAQYKEMEPMSLYITSIYFTVTTITTVGYGDISGDQNNAERVFCIMIMLAGVIAFSFATGTLASIIQNYDTQNAKLSEQLNTLNKIYHNYSLPYDLYQRLKLSLEFSLNQEMENLNHFLEELPQNLKIETSLYIHKDTYKNIYFLRDKQISLVAWICPLLKTYLATPDEYIYYEGDEVLNMYFMKTGNCGFVLPKYENAEYITITDGCDFGTEDIIACILKSEDHKGEEWIQLKGNLIRQFTVMTSESTELLLLSINDLNRIQAEFLEAYNTLMDVACQRLEYALLIKLECIQKCQEIKKKNRIDTANSIFNKIGLSISGTLLRKNRTYNFHPFNLADLDLHEVEESFIYIPTDQDEDENPAGSKIMKKQHSSQRLINIMKPEEQKQPKKKIGEIEEVNPDLEHSQSSNKKEQKSKTVQLPSISSSSSQDLSSKKSSSDSEDNGMEFMNNSVSNMKVHAQKRRDACLSRLQTIMGKQKHMMKEVRRGEQPGSFHRLQTIMKQCNYNDSSHKAVSILKHLSENQTIRVNSTLQVPIDPHPTTKSEAEIPLNLSLAKVENMLERLTTKLSFVESQNQMQAEMLIDLQKKVVEKREFKQMVPVMLSPLLHYQMMGFNPYNGARLKKAPPSSKNDHLSQKPGEIPDFSRQSISTPQTVRTAQLNPLKKAKEEDSKYCKSPKIPESNRALFQDQIPVYIPVGILDRSQTRMRQTPSKTPNQSRIPCHSYESSKRVPSAQLLQGSHLRFSGQGSESQKQSQISPIVNNRALISKINDQLKNRKPDHSRSHSTQQQQSHPPNRNRSREGSSSSNRLASEFDDTKTSTKTKKSRLVNQIQLKLSHHKLQEEEGSRGAASGLSEKNRTGPRQMRQQSYFKLGSPLNSSKRQSVSKSASSGSSPDLRVEDHDRAELEESKDFNQEEGIVDYYGIPEASQSQGVPRKKKKAVTSQLDVDPFTQSGKRIDPNAFAPEDPGVAKKPPLNKGGQTQRNSKALTQVSMKLKRNNSPTNSRSGLSTERQVVKKKTFKNQQNQ